MSQFLKQIAEHYYNTQNISNLCFVFPNRRSMVFFRKWLSETAKNDPQSRVFTMPELLTMNDFFYKVSGSAVTDRVSLLLELYDCYKALNPKAESLDDFIFWGDVILGDFDDTDKYLASPKQLFTNVADFKEIQDDYAYLSETQEEAIRNFISHFRKGGKLTVNIGSESPDVKERFLMIWNLLYPLYTSFNSALTEKGKAYEGMVYRSFVERLKTESARDILKAAFPRSDKFVFVGLNALNECEKSVMRKMRDASLAEFCWDYSSEMIQDPMNRASMFMSSNVVEFPQAFSIDPEKASGGSFVNAGVAEPENGPKIHVMSVPSSVGQTKQIPSLLAPVAEQKKGGQEDWSDTAIVLPDESLLIPVLNTLPLEIGTVNVTMGYPMSGSDIYSLMNNISALQLHVRKQKDSWAFYHKQVWSIFSSGIIASMMDGPARQRVKEIKTAAKYYIPQSDFAGIELFELIFRPVVTDAKATSAEQIKAFAQYQLDVLSALGAKMTRMSGMELEVHFAKQYYLSVNRLKSQVLSILPMTYTRLLQSLIGGISVPFNGEPLKGLQIMGPLETRALDFKNLIVLSCNEGTFPHRSVSSSFIPPELRKGFGLPTYENQDAVWAYYFFRMIQRAENVWLLYDSRTEGLKSGEESRYIKQLEYQYKYPLMDRSVVGYDLKIPEGEDVIEKTDEDVEIMKKMTFSASSIEKYLSCPAKFYYTYVKRLKVETEVSESLDNSMLGTVFHDTMLALYKGGEALQAEFDMSRENVLANVKTPLEVITKQYIEWLLSQKKEIIGPKIRTLIKRQLNADEIAGRNLVFEEILNKYVVKTLQTDLALMEEYNTDRFRVIGLELERFWDFKGHKFKGYIDRMDSFRDDEVRIVDYKTGKVDEKEVKINDENADGVVDALFSPDTKSKNRPEIAVQLFVYDRFVEKDVEDKSVLNVLYPIPRLFSSPELASNILSSRECPDFDDKVTERLEGLFAEMMDTGTDFRRTKDNDTCKYCDFKKICGR